MRKKLIEVALPLDAINVACKADKDRKTGTIRNLHKWFAPMPLPAWRGLLFASLVDDPDEQEARARLLGLVERLVASGGDPPAPGVVREARAEVARAWPEGPPTIRDPFCGGGSTLVEAQRLGCPTIGSDLNPVPALITRVLTELVPRVAGRPPVRGDVDGQLLATDSFAGLRADVKHYAEVIRVRALRQLSAYYPKADGDGEIIAWLWTRTARCPNPGCRIVTPLATTWVLSRKPGAESHIRPEVSGDKVRYSVFEGPGEAPPPPPKTGHGSSFRCVRCEATLDASYIRAQGMTGDLGVEMTAAVHDKDRRRRYRAATPADREAAAREVVIPAFPALEGSTQYNPLPIYGLESHSDLYLPRQLRAIGTFADEVASLYGDLVDEGVDGVYAQALVGLLGLSVGKLAQMNSSQVTWRTRKGPSKAEPAFGRHDLPMRWDFAETSPFGGSVGDWRQTIETALRSLAFVVPNAIGKVALADARSLTRGSEVEMFATDPPYFDQVPYSDLSDYFYVWQRRALLRAFPDLHDTLAAPKRGELTALVARHDGDRIAAQRYFVDGFTAAFRSFREFQDPRLPLLVVYAFREQEERAQGRVAPGWEAILEALLEAGMQIVGTWPIHATGSTRMRSQASNAVASYVLLVCRPVPESAAPASRRDFLRVLRGELRDALGNLQEAAVAPVDLAQAAVGPGMRIFSSYRAVVEADGSQMTVGAALGLINEALDALLTEQEADLDPATRWAVPRPRF